MDVKNFSIAGYDIVDELYTDFGTTESALEGWPAFRAAGFAIYEDETPHAGSPLQLGVDYELGGKDTRKSYELGEDIYTTLTMLTHDTGNIYITYNSIGSYVDADEVQELRSNYDTLLGLYDTAVQGLIPLRLDEQNISAAAKETDLTIYEPGGASAKLSGWRVTVRWTGGNGTYQFDTAYTITLGGLTAASWAGKGTGQLTLQFDLDNSDWIIVDPPSAVFDTWASTAASITYTYKHSVNGDLSCFLQDNNLITSNNALTNVFYGTKTYTLPTSFHSLTDEVKISCKQNSRIIWPIGMGTKHVTNPVIWIGGDNSASTGYIRVTFYGRSRA